MADDLVWELAKWITPGGLMGDDPADWEEAAKRLLASIKQRGPWLPGEAYGPPEAGSVAPTDWGEEGRKAAAEGLTPKQAAERFVAVWRGSATPTVDLTELCDHCPFDPEAAAGSVAPTIIAKIKEAAATGATYQDVGAAVVVILREAAAGSATPTEDLAVLARIGRMYLDALDDDPANEMLTLPEAMAVTDVRDAVERAEAVAGSTTPTPDPNDTVATLRYWATSPEPIPARARVAMNEASDALEAAAGSATPTEPAFVFEGTFDALAASRGWWDHGEYRWVIYAYTAAAGSATPTKDDR